MKKTVKEYRARWEIDVDADTPEAAASAAHAIMLDKNAASVVFDVIDVSIIVGGKAAQVDLLCRTVKQPDWCVLLRMPEQDELDPCDRIVWNVKAKSAKAAASKARKEVARAYSCDTEEVGVRAVALGEDSIILPWEEL